MTPAQRSGAASAELSSSGIADTVLTDRLTKEKLGDIRAAIHKLETGRIKGRGREEYIASLQGRLGHIERICAQDASPLRRRLELVLAGAVKPIASEKSGSTK